jgi:hypothetical protein
MASISRWDTIPENKDEDAESYLVQGTWEILIKLNLLSETASNFFF